MEDERFSQGNEAMRACGNEPQSLWFLLLGNPDLACSVQNALYTPGTLLGMGTRQSRLPQLLLDIYIMNEEPCFVLLFGVFCFVFFGCLVVRLSKQGFSVLP